MIEGRSIRMQCAFAVFATIADAFDEHVRILATLHAYARARAALPDVDAYVDALAHSYATDPNYAAALHAVIQGSDLKRFDA